MFRMWNPVDGTNSFEHMQLCLTSKHMFAEETNLHMISTVDVNGMFFPNDA